MKTREKLISLILLVFLISFGHSTAQAGWWETGLNLFKTTGEDGQPQAPNINEIGQAFKEALRIGAENVVDRLGGADGFNGDPEVHIPLPKQLDTVKTMLSKVGMSQMVDDLELKLNRAAEAATPEAEALFIESIQEMTFEDIKGIYEGPEDSATRYFQEKMSPELGEKMRPIVEESLSKVGAVQAFDRVMGRYKALPLVPDVKADLTDHVVQKGMDGIFYYLAKEEAAIRTDPVK